MLTAFYTLYLVFTSPILVLFQMFFLLFLSCFLNWPEWPTQPRWLKYAGWRMGCHPTAVCDQAGDQHEEEVPGCCGCVCFFHTLLRLLFVKWINCLIDNMSCFFKLQSSNPPNTKWVNGRISCLALAEKIWQIFSCAQPTYSALLLIPQVHVPYKWGTIWKGTIQAFQRYKIYFQKALLPQRNNQPNTNLKNNYS